MDKTLQQGEPQTPVSASSQGGQGGVAVPADSLAELEHRWERLVDIVRDLREGNATLAEQLKEREGRIVRMEQAIVAKSAEVLTLTEERQRTVARIENLLARFDDLGGECVSG